MVENPSFWDKPEDLLLHSISTHVSQKGYSMDFPKTGPNSETSWEPVLATCNDIPVAGRFVIFPIFIAIILVKNYPRFWDPIFFSIAPAWRLHAFLQGPRECAPVAGTRWPMNGRFWTYVGCAVIGNPLQMGIYMGKLSIDGGFLREPCLKLRRVDLDVIKCMFSDALSKGMNGLPVTSLASINLWLNPVKSLKTSRAIQFQFRLHKGHRLFHGGPKNYGSSQGPLQIRGGTS